MVINGIEYELVRWIADLHLGNGSPGDDFNSSGQEEALIEFLIDTREEGGAVIICGDFLEMWQFSLYDIINRYIRVFKELMTTPYMIIRGNHDMRIPPIHGIRIGSRDVQCGVVSLHGHQFDKYNRGGAIVGRVTTWILGKIESRYPDIDTDISRLRQYIPPMSSDVNYPLECAKLGSALFADTVVFGHTHTAGHWNLGGVNVYNAGTWVGGRCDYVELRNGNYQLLSWGGADATS